MSILDYILFKMKIFLNIRCYSYDPDPMKKVIDPDGHKSTVSTGFGSSSLLFLPFLRSPQWINP